MSTGAIDTSGLAQLQALTNQSNMVQQFTTALTVQSNTINAINSAAKEIGRNQKA
jgi:hypothetical protein